MFANVHHVSFSFLESPFLLWDEADDFIQIQDGTVDLVPFQMVGPHADFAEVTRMVFVEVDTMVVLTTGITSTTRMLTAGKTMSDRE